MQRLYEDEHPFIQILFTRQTGKSTYLASRMAFLTTTRTGFHVNYVTYEDESLSTFSNIKFRQAVWNTTPLRKYVQGEQGIQGEDADSDPTNEIQTFVTQTKNGIQVEVLPGSRTSANLPRCSIPGQIAFPPTIAFNGDNTNPGSIPETIIEATRISDALDSYQIDFVNPGTVRELVSITPHCLKLSD